MGRSALRDLARQLAPEARGGDARLEWLAQARGRQEVHRAGRVANARGRDPELRVQPFDTVELSTAGGVAYAVADSPALVGLEAKARPNVRQEVGMSQELIMDLAHER